MKQAKNKEYLYQIISPFGEIIIENFIKNSSLEKFPFLMIQKILQEKKFLKHYSLDSIEQKNKFTFNFILKSKFQSIRNRYTIIFYEIKR